MESHRRGEALVTAGAARAPGADIAYGQTRYPPYREGRGRMLIVAT